ncbi:helix-turn-helix domain-containing protein [Aeromonas sp. 31P]
MNSVIQEERQTQPSTERVAVLTRITNLTAELVQRLAEKKCLTNALNMTDNELAKLIFETQLSRSAEVSAREQRKITRLNEGAVKFAERLATLGGTCRASGAADILGVKRQTINNRLKANKLLAIKIGGENRFPVFQFDGDHLVDGLEDVLVLLGNISPITKTSFLTAMYFFDNENDLNVIDALKKYGSLDEKMTVIRKQAKLFGHQVSH